MKSVTEETPRFVELGQVTDMRTEPDVQFRMNQGVSKKREQTKIFKLTQVADKANLKLVVGAAYRQVFGRDIAPFVITGNYFTELESKLGNAEINLKEFIQGLGVSSLYIKEFYAPYPNTKVIELGTQHFLGRAPLDQAEIRKYNQILASQGLKGFVNAMVNSMEYGEVFGEDTVPYNRFPTLPAANYPNTQTLYNTLTRQNKTLVVPSFEPGRPLDMMKTPLLESAMANGAATSAKTSLLVASGRSIAPSNGEAVDVRKPARIFRMNPSMTLAETDVVLNAIYGQVMDVFGEQVPDEFRNTKLDSKFRSADLSVREFVRALASSETYARRFHTPYPSAKVVEFLFRHLLGRAPASQDEISQYTMLLATGGLTMAVGTIVGSTEYARYFGEDVVPYHRAAEMP